MFQILNPAVLNPITKLWLFAGLALSVLFSTAIHSLIVYTVIWAVLIFLSKTNMKLIYKFIKPYLIFLPIMSLFYIAFSFLLTPMHLNEILIYAVMAIMKLSLLICIMSLYFVISDPSNLLIAFRSMWSKTRFPIKFIEDFILYLSLVMRFYPMIQQEWTYIIRSRRALQLTGDLNKWKSTIQLTRSFPGILINVYKKAENIAAVMIMRGYGQQIPRGVTFPIAFGYKNIILIVIISVSLSLVNYYVTV